MNTLPDEALAILDLYVAMELMRVEPERPCKLCLQDDPCAWHKRNNA